MLSAECPLELVPLCEVLFYRMLFIQSDIMLSIVVQNVIMPSVLKMNGKPKLVMLSNIMLSVVMLRVVYAEGHLC
jgi:hypothetical protein